MSSPALKRVVAGIQKVYPLELAERSWDNVGLLVDSGSSGAKSGPFRILLTIDLTRAVCAEALVKNIDLVLAYHPFIFKGLKQITHQDSKQLSLVELIKHNVSVYSPHTSVDAVKGGVNDWLASGITKGEISSSVIIPDANVQDAGMGRVLTLSVPTDLKTVAENIKKSLGIPHIQISRAQGTDSSLENIKISTVALCAGSGASVFGKLKDKVDLIYTGELSHHEVLEYKENGTNVIVCNHSNTERGYLKEMKAKLQHALGNEKIEFEISSEDHDPLEVY